MVQLWLLEEVFFHLQRAEDTDHRDNFYSCLKMLGEKWTALYGDDFCLFDQVPAPKYSQHTT